MLIVLVLFYIVHPLTDLYPGDRLQRLVCMVAIVKRGIPNPLPFAICIYANAASAAQAVATPVIESLAISHLDSVQKNPFRGIVGAWLIVALLWVRPSLPQAALRLRRLA